MWTAEDSKYFISAVKQRYCACYCLQYSTGIVLVIAYSTVQVLCLLLLTVQYSSPYNRPRRLRGEQMYSCTLPSTSALDGVGGQLHAPAALPPVKTQYPKYRRLGWPQDRSGRVRKISPPLGFDARTVQPVERTHGHNSRPLWHPVTGPNNTEPRASQDPH